VAAVLFLNLPGRGKSGRSRYCFRLSRLAENLDAPGCVMLWEVYGGETLYQVAVERTAAGALAWSCTCPAHAYMVEDTDNPPCKHVRAIQCQSEVH
jgi:hypothetical protein